MNKKGFDAMKWIRSIRDRNAEKLLRMTSEERMEYFHSRSREDREEMARARGDTTSRHSDEK